MENSSCSDVKKEVEVKDSEETVDKKIETVRKQPLNRVLLVNRGGATGEQLFDLFLKTLSEENNGNGQK